MKIFKNSNMKLKFLCNTYFKLSIFGFSLTFQYTVEKRHLQFYRHVALSGEIWRYVAPCAIKNLGHLAPLDDM